MVAITNVMGSQATRDAHGVLFTRAGLEVSVAATKTFVSQVSVMYLLGLKLAQVRGTLPPERIHELVAEVKQLPHLISELLARIDEPIEGDRRALGGRRLLPLPRPPRRPAGLPRGRAQAEGDLLHPHRRLRGR